MRRAFTGTNYCGPGGDGPVLNELDAACKEHDDAYGKQGYSSYLANQDADSVFLRRIAAIKPGSRRERLTRAIAIGYFTGKVTAVDAIRKIMGYRQSGIKDYFREGFQGEYPRAKRSRTVGGRSTRYDKDHLNLYKYKYGEGPRSLRSYALGVSARNAERKLRSQGMKLRQRYRVASYARTNRTRYSYKKRFRKRY